MSPKLGEAFFETPVLMDQVIPGHSSLIPGSYSVFPTLHYLSAKPGRGYQLMSQSSCQSLGLS